MSIIGLDDIVRKAGLAAGATKKPFVFYLAVCGVYLIFTFLSGLSFQYFVILRISCKNPIQNNGFLYHF